MMARSKSLDAVLVERLSGREKLQALVRGTGHTFNSFAVRVVQLTGVGCSGDQVKKRLYGAREYEHVDLAIHLEYDVALEEITEALAEEPAVQAAEVAP